MRAALISVGAQDVLVRRRGGQSHKPQSSRVAIRRILIEELYQDLSASLKKRPTGAATIARIQQLLALRGFDVSEDVRTIGTSTRFAKDNFGSSPRC